jgi:hypothetical protein
MNIKYIILIKSLIAFPGIFILAFSMMFAAITGNLLAKKVKKRRLIEIKKKRMPIIGLLGIFVLIPAALYLNHLASNNIFNINFYIVQGIELLAGAINFTLLFLNIKDSIKYKPKNLKV